MPLIVAQAFKDWLKSSTNMALSSNAAVKRLTHEGIINFESLFDFDKKSLESLPTTCAKTIPAIRADPANHYDLKVDCCVECGKILHLDFKGDDAR